MAKNSSKNMLSVTGGNGFALVKLGNVIKLINLKEALWFDAQASGVVAYYRTFEGTAVQGTHFFETVFVCERSEAEQIVEKFSDVILNVVDGS